MESCQENQHFFQSVYEIVWKIPFGKVTSYGAIAKCLGAAKSSRIIGWAMNASHAIKGIPAHRVVNRNGVLTGKFHFENPNMMQDLLAKEGIQVIDDKIVNFSKIFWDPSIELTKELL